YGQGVARIRRSINADVIVAGRATGKRDRFDVRIGRGCFEQLARGVVQAQGEIALVVEKLDRHRRSRRSGGRGGETVPIVAVGQSQLGHVAHGSQRAQVVGGPTRVVVFVGVVGDGAAAGAGDLPTIAAASRTDEVSDPEEVLGSRGEPQVNLACVV